MFFSAQDDEMRRTTTVEPVEAIEPIERIEPAEPLLQIIKGRHAPRANP